MSEKFPKGKDGWKVRGGILEDEETRGGVNCQVCLELGDEERGKKVRIGERIERWICDARRVRVSLHDVTDEISGTVS